ncbi:MAG: imidazole glycerol phosphate synthase subunit HisH [Candidatus Obscuribacterales bacterium]|jgi:glutamine amidotransferase
MTSTEFAVDLVTSVGGNLGSVGRSLTRLGINFNSVDASNPPDGSRPVILPGVGAFGAVMASLREGNFDQTIKSLVNAGTPFLGVCVGMQILFDSSEEAPGVTGLGLVKGSVVKFTQGKVPQTGWNEVRAVNDNGWPTGFVYFVNSFYAKPENDLVTLYEANYFGQFCAAVSTANITAFQFHPEKSGEFGEGLLKKWVSDVV